MTDSNIAGLNEQKDGDVLEEPSIGFGALSRRNVRRLVEAGDGEAVLAEQVEVEGQASVVVVVAAEAFHAPHVGLQVAGQLFEQVAFFVAVRLDVEKARLPASTRCAGARPVLPEAATS